MIGENYKEVSQKEYFEILSEFNFEGLELTERKTGKIRFFINFGELGK